MERSDACKLPGGARYGSGCSLDVINSFNHVMQTADNAMFKFSHWVQCTKLMESLGRVERIEAIGLDRIHKQEVQGKSVLMVVLRNDLSVNHILSCVVVELST